MATAKKKSNNVMSRLRNRIESAQDDVRDAAQKRAGKMGQSVVDLQRRMFHSTIDGMGKVQEEAGKQLKRLADNAKWMPGEGKEIIDEWVSTSKKGREDFKKSMEKSFDLMDKYFHRVEGRTPAKKKAASKKKTATKKKAASKKKSATKSKAKAKPRKKAASRKKKSAAGSTS